MKSRSIGGEAAEAAAAAAAADPDADAADAALVGVAEVAVGIAVASAGAAGAVGLVACEDAPAGGDTAAWGLAFVVPVVEVRSSCPCVVGAALGGGGASSSSSNESDVLSGLSGSSMRNALMGAVVGAVAGSESKSSRERGSSGSSVRLTEAGSIASESVPPDVAATRATSAAMAPVLFSPVLEVEADVGVVACAADGLVLAAALAEVVLVADGAALADDAEDVLLADAASDDVSVDDAGAGLAAGREVVACVGDDADERATVGEVPADDVEAVLVEFTKTVGRGGGFAAGGGAAAGAGRAGGTIGIADFERGLLGIVVRALVLVAGTGEVGFLGAAEVDAVAEVDCVADEADGVPEFDCVADDVVCAGFAAVVGRVVDAEVVTGLADRVPGDVGVVRAVVCPAFAAAAASFAAVVVVADCVAALD